MYTFWVLIAYLGLAHYIDFPSQFNNNGLHQIKPSWTYLKSTFRPARGQGLGHECFYQFCLLENTYILVDLWIQKGARNPQYFCNGRKSPFEVNRFEVLFLLEKIQGEVHDGRQVPADKRSSCSRRKVCERMMD